MRYTSAMNPQNQTISINFTPLARFKLLSGGWVFAAFMGVSMLVGIALVLMIIAFSPSSETQVPKPLAFTMLVASVALIVGVVSIWKKTKKRNKQALIDFASVNTMRYIPASASASVKPGTLFEAGHSRRYGDTISGTLNGLLFEVYPYTYETGSGKHRQSHDAMIFEFTLPRVVPHFVIDSELEDVIPLVFHSSQKIELEGNFHKYFDLYAPDSYNITALTLLAPDTMEVLMQHSALC